MIGSLLYFGFYTIRAFIFEERAKKESPPFLEQTSPTDGKVLFLWLVLYLAIEERFLTLTQDQGRFALYQKKSRNFREVPLQTKVPII